jgi:hypothetical protein
LVFDLTASEQVWNYSCYAYDSEISEVTRLDPGTAGINTSEKKELENAGISAAAATAIFDRIRSSKGPFARFSEIEELEAVSAQDLDKLRSAAFTLWGDRQAHQVVTDLKCATDGVSEDHLDTVGGDPNGFVKNYTYNLVVADDGTVIRGEWTGESIEEHPDFAWVPYANEVRASTNEEWRRHGSYENYIKHILNSRYAPSENVFLFTDILDTLIDVRENAPVVCNVDPDDCGEGRVCNPVDGTCEEAPSEPAPADDGCMGGETHTTASTTISETTTEAISGKVCSGRDSWFLVALEEGQKAEITISFNHALGDIDMELQQANGFGLAGRSTSTANNEAIIWTAKTTGDHFLRIYGYSGAANDVELTVTISSRDSETCAEEDGEANNNFESATPITPGTQDGAICGNDSDFYQVSETGSWTFTLTFTHAEGDLDIKSFGPSGAQTAISQGTVNTETVSGTGPGFVEVYGYNGAKGAYSVEFTAP